MDENDEYSENGSNGDNGNDDDDDRGSSTADIGDGESSKSIEAENEEPEKRNTEILRRNDSSPTVDMADEESEGELDDDQMMAIDDQLAQILKGRERGKKDKGSQSHLTELAFVDSRHRGGTKRSDTLQKPRYGSFRHLR
jgi:DNA polymerase phi